MVQLPTEQSIGDLPDRLPRRAGVGQWQPGDLARGAEQLSRGVETLGLDLGQYAGQQIRQQNQADAAAADSQWSVDSIKTHDVMSQQTQPAIAASFANSHQSNFDSAADLIRDPNEAAKWKLQHAPELARYQVATTDFANGLKKNQDIAGFENDANTLVNSALSTPDQDARNGAIRAITTSGQSLVANGTLTPEQWQTRSAEIAHQYADGWFKSARGRAEAHYDPATGIFVPGDTSELEKILKQFQFEPNAPGGWGQPAGGPGAVVPPTTQPAAVGGFGNAVARTLGFEGGKLVTDVNGAKVRWGLNQAWNKDVDLANLTPQAAAAIYKTKYWDPINGDQLAQQNPALAHVAFDTSVIAGPERAKELIAQSGGDPQKFMDLRDQYLQSLLKDDPQKYARAATAWKNRDASLRADIAQAPAQPTGASVQPAGAAGPELPAGSSFVGLPPATEPGSPNPHLMPPRSQWIAGAKDVKMDPDGVLRYTMSDGSTRPVPGSRATGAFGAPSPGNTGTVLDALKPVDRAEIGLQAQNAINEIQRQNQAATKQYYEQAHKDLGDSVQNMINGNGVGPNERAQKTQRYANSPVPEVRQDYTTWAFIMHNLDSFKGQSPEKVQARVENMQSEYNRMRETNPDDPRLKMAGDVLDASQKFAKLFQEQAFKTPLERAVAAGGLPGGVDALDPQDPNIAAKIAKRVSDAHTAADFLGGENKGSVPIKYLQQSERPIFKQIVKQGGQPLVDLTRNIVEGAGADAGAIFKELGGDSQAMQWMGMHAAMGGDPEALNERASVLQAKSERKELPNFGRSFASNFYLGGDSPLGSAMSGFGAPYTGMIHDAASDLMTAQALRDGKPLKVDHTDYDKNFVEKAYNLALGATYQPDGTRYGGLASRTLGGGWWGIGSAEDRVVIPNNIKASAFDDVIKQIDGEDIKKMPQQPVSKNQTPITARQIQDGYLEAAPDKDGIFRGKYSVYTDGIRDDDHMVRNKDGTRWALDLAQPDLDTSLRRKMPGSFLGGVEGAKIPTPTAPTKQKYENTPGVVALSGAAEQE